MGFEWLNYHDMEEQLREVDWKQLEQLRMKEAQTAPFVPDQLRYMIATYLESEQEMLLFGLQANKFQLQIFYRQAAQYGERPSTPETARGLAVTSITAMRDLMLLKAWQNRRNGQFPLWYDAQHGMGQAMESIEHGVFAQTSTPDILQRMLEQTAERDTLANPLPDGSTLYPSEYVSTVLAHYQRTKELLDADPSGVQVVRYGVTQLEGLANGTLYNPLYSIEWYHTPEYVAAGARYGQAIFTEVSAIAQAAFPQQPVM